MQLHWLSTESIATYAVAKRLMFDGFCHYFPSPLRQLPEGRKWKKIVLWYNLQLLFRLLRVQPAMERWSYVKQLLRKSSVVVLYFSLAWLLQPSRVLITRPCPLQLELIGSHTCGKTFLDVFLQTHATSLQVVCRAFLLFVDSKQYLVNCKIDKIDEIYVAFAKFADI